jgi:type II restriction enzyme
LKGSAVLYLVAPDLREKDVQAQLCGRAFSRIADLDVPYLRYSDLGKNREAIARFGTGLKGLKGIEAIARRLT